MSEYVKGSYREAVLFLFKQDNLILIEHRPTDDGVEVFIPNGGIQEIDLEGDDYRLTAVKREIREEFNGAIEIRDWHPLGEYIVEELAIKFYGYVIIEWEGILPKYTVEDGRLFAKLEWIPIEKYEDHLNFESAIYFVRKNN